MTRFQFVADHRNTFELKRLCQTVGVSRSAFYAWEAGAEARAARAQADQELAERIRAVHATDRGLRSTADHRGDQRRRLGGRAGEP